MNLPTRTTKAAIQQLLGGMASLMMTASALGLDTPAQTPIIINDNARGIDLSKSNIIGVIDRVWPG
jgi:hypothetical protein